MKRRVLVAFMLMIPSVAFAWPWSKDMMNQISIKPQQDPIPFPPRSVPVPGTATIYVPDDYATRMPNPIPPTAASVEKGRELFTIYCTACHGPSGTGNGTVGEKLTLRPFDLTRDAVQSLPDGFIFGVLTFGGVVMPSYANDLSPTERWHVVNFVHYGLQPAPSSKGAVEAKIEYCQDCHGPSGQGHRGFYPIPRLAGQQPEYLKNQLQAFVERRRPNAVMSPVAQVLSPAMITALAAKFAEFNPEPLGGAAKALAAEGEKIFQDGVAEANVPACAACHGPEAQGREQVARLAGQLSPYIVKALTNWSSERGQNSAKPDNSAIMKSVARSLTKQQVEAVAAYISELK